MSATFEKISSNKVKLSFTVPGDEFEAAVQKSYLKNRGKINVPGFRKGKAPRRLIESMYGETVFYDDAMEEIMSGEYEKAIDEYSFEPVDRPEADVQEAGSGKDFQFTIEVFVRPDVTLGEYKALEVEVAKQTVTDAQIEARIDQDRQKNARTIEVEDRPVAEGDSVNLDYAGTVDGVAFEGGTAEGQTLKIGSHTFIPGFEEQMVGMNLNEEKDIQVRFPDDYSAEELKGKDAVFHVKVNRIEVTELPELDDDFAADVSEFDTFEAYRENIVKELTERADKSYDAAIENALVEKAVENAQVDIPGAMIERQIDYMLRELEMRMAYSGMRMEDYMKYTNQTLDDLRTMYRNDAENRVKTDLVIEAIRKTENIEPTEEDVAKTMAEQAERMGKTVEDFEKDLTDDQRAYLKDTAAVGLVIDLLKKDAKVTEPAEKKEDPAEESENKD